MAGLVLAGRSLLDPTLGPAVSLALSALGGVAVYTTLVRFAAPSLFAEFRELLRLALSPAGSRSP